MMSKSAKLGKNQWQIIKSHHKDHTKTRMEKNKQISSLWCPGAMMQISW